MGADRPPTCARERPSAVTGAHQNQAILGVGPRLDGALRGRVPGRDLDHALDDCGTRASADQAGVGTRAEQQAEPGDDHGLARAGLTGDDVQAGVQLQDGVIDDPEVLDADLLQHRARLSHGTDAPRQGLSPRGGCDP